MAASSKRDARVESIRRAAIPVFAAQGFRNTSMADLAAAAGVSRPALYQYFANRADLFVASFDVVLQDSANAALAALESGKTVVERLDGYLQHAHGDGYESLSSTPFGEELMEASHEFAADVAEAALDRMRHGLRDFLASLDRVDAKTLAEAIDLLLLSPAGLKSDHPSPTTYRHRLSALARATARLLDNP